MVAAGQPERAEQLAHTIPDPDRQAQVLTELAVVLAKHASTAASICSCRVTATSLTSSLWFRAMPVLASLAPAAVAAAGAAILDVLDRSLGRSRVEGAVPAPTRGVPSTPGCKWSQRRPRGVGKAQCAPDCETARLRYPPLLIG
jgi:hypothetical protein